MLRKASTMKRKIKGTEYCIMCQITPPYEYTFTSAWSEPVSARQALLMMPTCGLARMPQAIAVSTGGIKNGKVISTSSLPRHGVSVRAMIHASAIASSTDGTVLTNEMPMVLARISPVCQVKTAR
jgi:hypothetical protein